MRLLQRLITACRLVLKIKDFVPVEETALMIGQRQCLC